ncbi:MAG: hypothetical protein ABIG39_07525 [Candidatus Micrarchaeota archaeon]
MQPIYKHKKKKEENKGFDLLQAKFLDQGLVASGDTRSLGLRAVAQTHTHTAKHRSEKLKKSERKFKSEVKKGHAKALSMRRGTLASIRPVKIEHSLKHKPRQLKDDKEDPESPEKDSGPEKEA